MLNMLHPILNPLPMIGHQLFDIGWKMVEPHIVEPHSSRKVPYIQFSPPKQSESPLRSHTLHNNTTMESKHLFETL